VQKTKHPEQLPGTRRNLTIVRLYHRLALVNIASGLFRRNPCQDGLLTWLKNHISSQGALDRALGGGNLKGLPLQAEGGNLKGLPLQAEEGNLKGLPLQAEGGNLKGLPLQAEEGNLKGLPLQAEGGNLKGLPLQAEEGNLKGLPLQAEEGNLKGLPLQAEGGNLKGLPLQAEGGNLKGLPLQAEGGNLKGLPLQAEGRIRLSGLRRNRRIIAGGKGLEQLLAHLLHFCATTAAVKRIRAYRGAAFGAGSLTLRRGLRSWCGSIPRRHWRLRIGCDGRRRVVRRGSGRELIGRKGFGFNILELLLMPSDITIQLKHTCA
jgi:hypothetical protein